jgi:two-component system, sensor histidine kinase and response regulator
MTSNFPEPRSENQPTGLMRNETSRFRALLFAGFIALMIGLFTFAERIALRAEEEGLQRLARTHAELIISFRNFYSSKLLPIVREHSDLAITHDYKNQPAALPIPATMTLDFVEQVAKANPGINLRLVSPYPFPWRSVTLEPFEVDAMAVLQSGGMDEFLRVESTEQGKVMRYAAPIRMEESCVACHNSHKDSPKRDWKVGDVRGIQVMSLPIKGLSYGNHPQFYLFAALLLLAFGAGGCVLIWLHARGVGALNLAKANADSLRDRQQALDAHAIVSIADKEGRIIYANDQFCEISGYSREELLGQNHSILKSGVHSADLYAGMWKSITKGQIWQGEICNRKKTGGVYWVKSTIYPCLDNDGLPFQYIAIRTDITERKAVEDELSAKRHEAEAANEAKSEFLANMSHEIRTPMNGIIGMTDLAIESDREVERQDYMKIVKNSAESLLRILNDILDFSKIEANKMMIERVEFSLRDAVSDSLKTLAPRSKQKNLELICSIADDVPAHVIGDPTRLRQVLYNLIGNAIKFTEKGEIVVSLAVEARDETSITLQVVVQDSGIGIPTEKLERIFEAFSQADTSTTREYGGTGLGLSISSRLVELMGGRISVDSEPGKGSTFQFNVVMGVSDTPAKVLDTAILVGKRVLVVDDNAVNREIFLRQLDRWGMKAAAAASGQEAQELCSQSSSAYDVVLLDQNMPDMDGITLAEWMRAQPHMHGTPLMILSSGPMKDSADRAHALNLHGYLSKPVTDTELRGAILRALGAADSLATVAPAATTPNPTASGSKLDVLIVEDNAINQLLVIRLLEKWGHQVALAVNGKEAVDRLSAGERYDVVLMDMQMPVMGGIEATGLIRANEKANGRIRTPIVAMTANAMQGDRETCLQAGMDDYLSKPINQVELAAKLRQFTKAADQPQADVSSEKQKAAAPAAIFDYAKALAGVDADMLGILAPAFLEHGPDELAALRAAIANGDAPEAMRRAHGLKGTLAAFGAEPAAQLSAKIEAMAREGDLTRLGSYLETLEAEMGKLMVALAT